MPMKNSCDTMGNRTRDLPVCSAVPQPTAPTRVIDDKDDDDDDDDNFPPSLTRCHKWLLDKCTQRLVLSINVSS
jgi:hypothetical protein